MTKKGDLIYRVAVNDADFSVKWRINGRQKILPSYNTWRHMLCRVFDVKYHKNRPTYSNCTVCSEWLYFSNFHEWYEAQYKEPGWHLDKDLLVPGNKVYSPDTCIFVSSDLNVFLTDRSNYRGQYMLGVNLHKRTGKLVAQISNPFTKKREHLGLFGDELEAHLAWKKRKHELACQLADMITYDDRLVAALRSRYEQNKEPLL